MDISEHLHKSFTLMSGAILLTINLFTLSVKMLTRFGNYLRFWEILGRGVDLVSALIFYFFGNLSQLFVFIQV